MRQIDSGLLLPDPIRLPRGARPFMPAFGGAFQPAFATQGGVTPWYLSGGIALANCVAAYQPKGAADLAASKINLAHPGTNDAAAGTNPSFATATGWTFLTASSQYLTTGITPLSGYSMIVAFDGVIANDTGNCLVGALDGNGSNRFYLLAGRTNGAFTGTVYGIGGIANTASVLSGTLAIAGQNGYKNGSIDTAVSTGTFPIIAINIGRTGYSGFYAYASATIQAMSIYSVTITAPQILALSTAMAAL